MNWLVLLISAVLEAVWATALGQSDGGSDLRATTIFVIAMTLSMIGLAYSARTIPIGTAYAVWVAIGAVLTVVYGMATGEEPVSAARIICMVGIVGAVVGLKLQPEPEPKTD